jgi:protein PET100, fungi type
MYIMLPIASMWYFGTNLDGKFSVEGFWPSAEMTHKIPFDRDELKAEAERLRQERLERKARREQLAAATEKFRSE